MTIVRTPEDVKIIADQLFASQERNNARHNWDVLEEYILPNQYGALASGRNSSPGIRRTDRIFDSTAIQANHDLASSIQGTLTNSASKWSKIRFKEDDLNDNDEATAWLEEANDRIHSYLSESNFDTQVGQAYQYYTALGSMTMLHEAKEDEDGNFLGYRFTTWHLSEIAIAENKDGLVDTIVRKFKMTAKQAFEKWGDKVSEKIFEEYHNNPTAEFDFIHYIGPRQPREVKLNELGLAPGKFRPIASLYVESGQSEILEESGYYELPIYVSRWSKAPGEIYGRGPGRVALPDIRTLNRTKELILTSAARAVNPSYLTTQRNVLAPLRNSPGHVNVVRNINDIKEWSSQARFDVGQLIQQDLQQSIKAAFFIDKLLLPPRTETGEMTAFEIAERIEQMQRVLGPTLSRINHEFLTPLITRSFKILLRNQVLPPLPTILKERGISVDIVFVNQLARSQKIEDVNNINFWVQSLANIAQYKPEVLDLINADGIAKHTAKIQGVPEIAVSSAEEVAAVRQQRAKQQQQQQALEATQQIADSISKTGNLGEV